MISRSAGAKPGWLADLGEVPCRLLQPHDHHGDAEDDAARAAPAADEDRRVQDDRLHR